ncbi:MAG TPA: tripartite tricarboxylate transporter substrate binding protein [Pseudorhodoferax sp.]|nr:tripartite tricarboxylate transporter substrate binding protein [Pseudorhodoferax sp.]
MPSGPTAQRGPRPHPRSRLRQIGAALSAFSVLSGFLLLASAGSAAASDDFPNRPIRLVVPFAAGGAVDLIGRQIAQALTEQLGRPAIVENKPGVGGLIALGAVASAPADGYTLAVGGAGPLSISPSLYQAQRKFDPLTQLTPVIWYASTPGVLVVAADVKAQNVAELVTASKASPDSFNMGSAGSGSINHLMGEYFQQQAGVKWTHIPYKGSAPALAELMSGRLQVMMDIVPTAAPLVAGGKVRALAVTSPKRSTLMAQVPTLQELGYKDFDVSSWISLMAPAGTPAPVVQKLNAALNKALQKPEVRARLTGVGAEPEGGPAERVTARLKLELPRWAAIIKASGATAE